MSEITKIESLEETEKESGGGYARWNAEIQAAKKELEKFHRKGRKVVKEFRASQIEASGVDTSMERKYNLFAANVNILATALMNQAPSPIVEREFHDHNDDVARVACMVLERALAAHNGRNFHTANLMRQVVQDMLVPGAGLSWHTYHADIETKTIQPTASTLVEDGHDTHQGSGSPATALEYDEVVSEQVVDEYVYWEDLLWSPARTFEEVRWIGRKTYLTRDQLTKRFGAEGKKVPLNFNPKKNDNSVEAKNIVFQQAVVYEIWDKPSHKVIWWCEGMDKLLDEKDDFLELDDFFPCPQPLMAVCSNGSYLPIPDFTYAADQYRELNEINTRISLLVRACRVIGVYDKSAPQLQQMVNNAAENTLVPVDQWAAFAEKGGIKGVMDWLPLDQVVLTIEQLTKNREDVKQQIYEITGMSDIIRGQSKASETLGAQKIKTQYASMRIQERQKNVVQYCSSVFDIQAQLMRKHMDIQEIVKLSQAMFMNEEQEILQQAFDLIKNPDFILRARVESDTLSDIDFQAEKQDRMEYMSTITNYLKEVLPTMQGDPIMGPFLMHLLQFSLAGFKVGKKFEGELDKSFRSLEQKLANPQPPEPTPEEKVAEMELKGKEQEQQFKAQDAQIKQQGQVFDLNMKKQLGQQKIQQSQAEMNQKMRLSHQEGQLKAQQMGIKDQLERQRMWRQQQADALDFAQQQKMGSSFDRGGAR
jgi:hypothetical protein